MYLKTESLGDGSGKGVDSSKVLGTGGALTTARLDQRPGSPKGQKRRLTLAD